MKRLREPAVCHFKHPVTVVREGFVMGDYYEGGPVFPVELNKKIEKRVACCSIQVAGRLIRKHDLGILQERPCNSNTLLFSS